MVGILSLISISTSYHSHSRVQPFCSVSSSSCSIVLISHVVRLYGFTFQFLPQSILILITCHVVQHFSSVSPSIHSYRYHLSRCAAFLFSFSLDPCFSLLSVTLCTSSLQFLTQRILFILIGQVVQLFSSISLTPFSSVSPIVHILYMSSLQFSHSSFNSHVQLFSSVSPSAHYYPS